MSHFTVRVELLRAAEADYDKLDEVMAAAGFSRHVVDDAGNAYHLPTHEYDISGSSTAKEVFARVKAAVGKTRKDGLILVTAVAGRSWQLTKKT